VWRGGRRGGGISGSLPSFTSIWTKAAAAAAIESRKKVGESRSRWTLGD